MAVLCSHEDKNSLKTRNEYLQFLMITRTKIVTTTKQKSLTLMLDEEEDKMVLAEKGSTVLLRCSLGEGEKRSDLPLVCGDLLSSSSRFWGESSLGCGTLGSFFSFLMRVCLFFRPSPPTQVDCPSPGILVCRVFCHQLLTR